MVKWVGGLSNVSGRDCMSDRDQLNASLRTIAKGAGVSFIGAFIGLGLGYLSRIIIARWLGAEDYGLISL